MNYLVARCVLVLLVFNFVFLASCSEDDEPEKEKDPTEQAPAVLGRSIYKSAVPGDNGTLKIQDSVVISFHEKRGKQILLDEVRYRAIIDEVAIQNVITTSIWSDDSLKLTLYPKDMLESNQSYQVLVKAHWEYFDTSWKVVTWESEELRENHALTFTTTNPELKIKAENIQYTYPISQQYHFLPEEHPIGFIKLIRGQKSLFELTTHSFSVVYKKFTGQKVDVAATYNENLQQVEYPIPTTLDPQTIYQFELIAHNVETLEDISLVSFHFRTSKYKTFTEKFNALTYTGNTFSILVEPWRGHYLYQFVLSAGEYMDSYEAEVKTVNVTLNGNAHAVPYGSGMIQFEAVLQGTTWYNAIYPMLYAPWTESSFKPQLTRDTSLVSSPPVEAMSFYNLGSGILTPEMIASNSAPAIPVGGTNPAIIFSLPVIVWQDFNQIQQQAVTKYINLETIPAREVAIIYNLMPPITTGTYPFKVRYVLPSGEVTTTLQKQMIY